MGAVEKVEAGLKELCPEYNVVAAYLYGSFARDEQHEDSDIDIAVYFEDYDIQKLLEFGRRLQDGAEIDREIDVRALNSADLVFQFQVLKEGLVLYESDRSRRADIEQRIARKYHDMKPFIRQYREEMRSRLVESG